METYIQILLIYAFGFDLDALGIVDATPILGCMSGGTHCVRLPRGCIE